MADLPAVLSLAFPPWNSRFLMALNHETACFADFNLSNTCPHLSWNSRIPYAPLNTFSKKNVTSSAISRFIVLNKKKGRCMQ
jgi:hypothetical protein